MIPDSLRKYVYYEEPNIVLLHGDCLEMLPHFEPKSIDLVLTDPPYEKEAHTPMRRTRATLEGRRDKDEIPFNEISEEQRTMLANFICNWCLCFCQAEAVKDYAIAFGEQYRRPMVWIKPDSAPQFTGDRPAMGYESIVASWCNEGKSKWNGGGKRGVFTYNSTSDRHGHPTQKPIELIKELVELFHLGGIVLDPFLGSGTTAVAAKQLGRKCIGIELEKKYLDIAIERLRQEVLF